MPAKQKAKECADLLLLSIYVFIPPSRGLEIRTLEIVEEEESVEARKDTARNLLIQKPNGDIKLHFSNYKTRKFVGRDELALGVRRPVTGDRFDLTTFVVFCSVLFVFSLFWFCFLFCCGLFKTSLPVAEIFCSCFLSFQSEDELCRLMNLYIKDHRPKLVTESSQRYLLLVS